MERGYNEFGEALLPDTLREVLPFSGEKRDVRAKKIFHIGAATTAVVGALALVGMLSQVCLANLRHAAKVLRVRVYAQPARPLLNILPTDDLARAHVRHRLDRMRLRA